MTPPPTPTPDRTPSPAPPLADSRDTLSWWAFALVAAALLPIMVRASTDFGVTWDEKARHRYGELIWEFLRGLRPRSSLIDDEGGQYYGGMFDTICAAVERYVPLNRYVVRHALNAVWGWAGVVYAGRLAARFFGNWSGVLAMILLVLSPRYFADSMNNPKDLPFAAASIAALFYISTIAPRWPYISRPTAFKIAVAVAVALNIRAGALLYLGYMGLLLLAYIGIERQFAWRRLADTAARVAAITIGALVLGTVFWPWAQAAPLTRPVEALVGFANFPFIADMLFNGRYVTSNAVPWTYAPWWFLISTPPVVLLGVALSVIVPAWVGRDRARPWQVAALWAVGLTPIVLVIAMHSTLYDGVRHLLFVYPVLAVIAAAGWAAWLAPRNHPGVRLIAAALLAVGLAGVVTFDVRAYPNQAVYFNGLAGGPRGAFSRYEMDYWGNCLLEAVAWGAKSARLSGVPLTISGEPESLVQLDSERFHELMFTPARRNEQVLDVRLARGPVEGVIDLAARPDALYRVQTPDGAVLCVVLPGPRFADVRSHLVLAPAGSAR